MASLPPPSISNVPGLKSALRLTGPRFVAWGDSLIQGSTGGSSSSPIQQAGLNFSALAGVLAGNTVRFVHNAGVYGQSSTQILARFSTDVAAFNPDVVLILAGTNDVTSGSGITLATTKSNIVACVQDILSIGAVPIMGTIPPKTFSSTFGNTQLQELLQLNAWIRAYAAQHRYPLCDFFAALVDANTAAYQATYTLSLNGATSGTFEINVATQVVQSSRVQWPAAAAALNYPTSAISWNTTYSSLQTALNNVPSGQLGFANAFKVDPSGTYSTGFTIRSTTGYPFDLTLTSNSLSGGTTATLVANTLLSVDGIHPYDSAGLKVMANLLATLLKTMYPPLPTQNLAFLSNNNNGQPTNSYPLLDGTNLLYNGCFTSNYNTTADFWSLSTSNNTYSVAAPSASDNLVGNWMDITTTVNNSYALGQFSLSSGYSVGDTLAFSGRIRTTSMEQGYPLPWTDTTKQVSVSIDDSLGNKWRPISGWDINISDGWFYQEMTVQTGTTYINAYVYALGTGWSMQLGQMSVVNLTQNGLLNL